ncbi:MAG: hypothetical protein RIA71_01570 [Oceanicaulis sp.]
MGRLRRRLHPTSSAALEVPFSRMFSLSLFTAGLIWAVYIIFIWTVLSCAETVALTFGPSRHGVAVIDIFILIFLAFLALWFFNTARFRKQKQSWARRGVELLLIAFCLLVSVTWAGTAAPMTPEAQFAQTVRGLLHRTPLFFTDVVTLEEARSDDRTADGRTWLDDFDLNPHGVNPDDFPHGILTHPAERCLCWNKREESLREAHFVIDWREREGFMSSADAALLREDLPPPPTEPEWCPAVLELARPGA